MVVPQEERGDDLMKPSTIFGFNVVMGGGSEFKVRFYFLEMLM